MEAYSLPTLASLWIIFLVNIILYTSNTFGSLVIAATSQPSPSSYSPLIDVVKLASRDTPPPLHFSPATSDLERTSTTDSTPVGTPRAFEAQCGKRPQKERDREKDLLFSWHKKSPSGFAGGASSYVDTTLLEAGFDDSTYPLFGEEPFSLDMDGRSSPINITSKDITPRRNQRSNALDSQVGEDVRANAMDIAGEYNRQSRTASGRLDSISEGQPAVAGYSNGAQPMSMTKDRPRRESLASSMVGGMSFGGVSVGSWIRDEYVFSTCPDPLRLRRASFQMETIPD